MLRRRSRLAQRIQRHSSFATLYQGGTTSRVDAGRSEPRASLLPGMPIIGPMPSQTDVVQAKLVDIPTRSAIPEALPSIPVPTPAMQPASGANVEVIEARASRSSEAGSQGPLTSQSPPVSPSITEDLTQGVDVHSLPVPVPPVQRASIAAPPAGAYSTQNSSAEVAHEQAIRSQPVLNTPSSIVSADPPDPVWNRLQAIMRKHEDSGEANPPIDATQEMVSSSPAEPRQAEEPLPNEGTHNVNTSGTSPIQRTPDPEPYMGAAQDSPRQARQTLPSTAAGGVQREPNSPEQGQAQAGATTPTLDTETTLSSPRLQNSVSQQLGPAQSGLSPPSEQPVNTRDIASSQSQTPTQPGISESGNTLQTFAEKEIYASTTIEDLGGRALPQKLVTADHTKPESPASSARQAARSTIQAKPAEQQGAQNTQQPSPSGEIAAKPAATESSEVSPSEEQPIFQAPHQDEVQRPPQNLSESRYDIASSESYEAGSTQLHPLQEAWSVQRTDDQVASHPEISESEGGSRMPSILGGEDNSDKTTEILSKLPTGKPTHSEIEIIPPRRPRPVFRKEAETSKAADNLSTGNSPTDVQKPPASVPTEIGELPSDLWAILDEPIPNQPVDSPRNEAIPSDSPSTESHLGVIQPSVDEGPTQLHQSTQEPHELSNNPPQGSTIATNQLTSLQLTDIEAASVTENTSSLGPDTSLETGIALEYGNHQETGIIQTIPEPAPQKPTSDPLDSSPILVPSDLIQKSQAEPLSEDPPPNQSPIQDAIRAATRPRARERQHNNHAHQAVLDLPSDSSVSDSYPVLSPVLQRQPDVVPTNGSSDGVRVGAMNDEGQGAMDNAEQVDTDKLAQLVYEKLRRRMVVEQERLGRRQN